MRKSKAISGALSLCLILILILCSSTILRSCRAKANNILVCDQKEKQALLSFKHALLDPENKLSSWSMKEDCCGWQGVHCSNVTARVLELKLAGLNLGGEISPALLKLEYLYHLDLRENDLSSAHFGGQNHHANFSSLKYLDLSENNINGELPNWFFNLSNLAYLSVSGNQFKGQIPDSLGQFKYLDYLDLSFNSFHGPIPTSLGNLSSLAVLILCDNGFNGTLPTSMGRLSNLKALVLGYDSLTGPISEEHFTTLPKLMTIEISKTSLFFNVKSDWTPPFQLQFLSVSSCKMGPKFPAWIRTQQKSLSYLDFSSSGIEDAAPNWFWEFSSYIQQIHLSDNQISGDLSGLVLNSTIIDLSSNCFSGGLPRLSPNVVVLNIANNSFSGPLSPFMCQNMNNGTRSQLEVLDVSINALSGELSDCFMHWPSLIHINIGSNNLSGTIPNSMGSLVALKALSLHNNSLYGDVPSSLQNCKVLGLINLSDNKFSGIIPGWIVERTTLMVIHLRSNQFTGIIPPQICRLSSLTVLDLSDNSLSGGIPKCLSNFSAMAKGPIAGHYDIVYDALEADYDYESYLESLVLNTKGRDSEYKAILGYVRAIDLSSNHLSGSIPVEIFNLFGLQFLNLSHNHLTGTVPVRIGGMKYLESLDLSRNNLSGEIPQTITNLTFLAYMNLSYNNFSGRIPSSTQLQSLDPLCFFGNAQLCGAPLAKNCPQDEEPQHTSPHEESGEHPQMAWFYIGMGTGFIVGFWGVCGALFFKKAWRHAYFQSLDDMKDKVYVAIALRLKWLQNKT